MNRRIVRSLVAVALGTAVFLSGCGPDPRAQRAPQPLKVGDTAPEFTLETPDGRSISLDDFRDRRPVLLYFSMGPG
jgi:cytochrome oxidase Cu insertion factor (SCO1/SenC/PrrC family)